MLTKDSRPELVSEVRVVRRVPLGELAGRREERSAEPRCDRAGVAFNSSI